MKNSVFYVMVIDGRILASENAMIQEAIDHKLITKTRDEIQELCKNYYRGKGLPGLVFII